MFKTKNLQRITMVLLLTLLLSIFPVFATNDVELMTPNLSPWSVVEIVDAQRYDIFELNWYSSFRDDISKEKANHIYKKIEDKIKLNEIKPIKNEVLTFEEGLTRDAVLKNIFKIAKKYDNKVTSNTNYLEYFKETKVLLGNGNDFKLEEIATLEETVIFTKRYIDYFYDINNLGAKGLMWEVKNKDNTVYLLGSVHIANSDIYPFSSNMINKFNDSSKLFVEVNLIDPNITQTAMSYLYYSDGSTLESQITKQSYKEIKEIMTSLGVEENVYKHMKPWAVSLQISNLQMLANGSADYSAEHGIDMYFLLSALNKNKEIIELEGADFQYSLFDSIEPKDQQVLLDETIKAYKNPPTTAEQKEASDGLKVLLDSWKNADEATMRKYLKASSDSDNTVMSELLLGKRDHGMAEKIDKLLKEDGKNTYFVVVGAAHYVNDGSVVDILKDMGYNVKNLNK